MSVVSPKNSARSVPVIEGYDSLKEIGRGGFSRVYSAIHTKLDRPVAIKVLDVGMVDDNDRHRFEREIETMVRVSAHANIVTILDTAFTESGRPCIVMQLYSGGSLANRISANGTVAPIEALQIGSDIASALEASHQQGVLHCDLKPQNILISEFHQPALGDFGIATLAEERTRTGSGQGFTLHYAAPEVIEGGSQTAMSDVYSLAATIYTAIAGHRPFAPAGDKPAPKELARRILLTESPRLETSGTPVEVDSVLRRAMAKEPLDRPQTAAAFSSELDLVLNQLVSHGYNLDRDAARGIAKPAPSGQSPEATSGDVREASPIVVDDTSALTVVGEPIAVGESTVVGEATGARAPTRRRAAVSVLLVAVVVAAIIGALIQQQPDATEPVADLDRGARAPQVFAPERPQDVVLELETKTEVVVTWKSSESDVEFVVTEVNKGTRIETTDLSARLAIAEGETPCVRLMAFRGNRSSGPTEPECLRRSNP